MGIGRTRAWGSLAAASVILAGSFGVAVGAATVTATPATADPAPAGTGAVSFQHTGRCIDGTYRVPHGVTQVHILAVGADGTHGVDVTQNQAGAPAFFAGGAGGRGSELQATIPVSEGTTLYVGVTNQGVPGSPRSEENSA